METTQVSLDHLTWENPIGEARKDALRLDFDRKLKLELYNSVSKTVSKSPGAPFRKLNGNPG